MTSTVTTTPLYSLCLRLVRQSAMLMYKAQRQSSKFTHPAISPAIFQGGFVKLSPALQSEKPEVEQFRTTSVSRQHSRYFHTTMCCKKLEASHITEADYESYAEETLDSLTEFFEDLPETEQCNEDYDCAYGSGVLTIHLGSIEGTFVINKQKPNKQIWLSSPLSGPKRYDYHEGQWIYLRDGSSLHKLLEHEISNILGFKVNLTKCKFYGKGVGSQPS